jgi:hypothetical protein
MQTANQQERGLADLSKEVWEAFRRQIGLVRVHQRAHGVRGLCIGPGNDPSGKGERTTHGQQAAHVTSGKGARL